MFTKVGEFAHHTVGAATLEDYQRWYQATVVAASEQPVTPAAITGAVAVGMQLLADHHPDPATVGEAAAKVVGVIAQAYATAANYATPNG